MSSDSDSESDAEETKRLKAAAIEQPLSGGKNQVRHLFPKAGTPTHNLASKRPDKVREQEHEHELQTTPEFRSFVAKKLTEIIDSAIKVKQRWPESPEVGPRDDTPGIRLFSSSKPISDVNNFSNNAKQQKKSRTKKAYTSLSSSSDSSDDDDDAMFASVAVSGESIISKGSLHRLDQEPADTDYQAQKVAKMNSETSININSQENQEPGNESSITKRQKKRKHSIHDP